MSTPTPEWLRHDRESIRRGVELELNPPPTNLARKVRNQRLSKAYSRGYIDGMLFVGLLSFVLWCAGED